ncbi:MAG: phosphoglycerate kinase [Candidatus Levybacteria bacterium]|nr:phosphoglycerate kinase [Candidatus Levybacteria bacterium]
MRLKSLPIPTSLHNKTALIRIDSDVDIKNGKILDDTRLQSSISTISYVLESGGNVILIGHSGRPDGKVNSTFTLEPVAHWYANHFKGSVQKKDFDGFSGWEITPHLSLLENIRFYKEEEEGNAQFAKKLAKLGEIYINEAFAVSHRSHASITNLSQLLPSFAGIHLQEEVEALSKIMENPERPLGVLIGGAKLETKLPVVSRMHTIADYVMVGGKIAQENKELLKAQHEKTGGKRSALLVADSMPDGTDITANDTQNFIQIINLCKTIVWNGPFGKMGSADTEKNTIEIAKAIVQSGAYSIVGGGDSLSLLSQHNLLSKFSFVSTGGGAMLEFLAGKKLPGIEALLH